MRIAEIFAAGLLAAAGMGFQGQARAAEAPWGANVAEPVALLSRLHRAALHEVQLGELAQHAASTPDARQYGADLAADFQGVDQRIVSLAAGLGIPDKQLQVTEGAHVATLRKDSADYTRLANESGTTFDRDFWVTVADAQAHESDLLATTASREPALTDLVTQMSRLYDRSSRRALAAAHAGAAQPTETPPDDEASTQPSD
ncbi:MAG: DUF4142 domain-containing protein [Verrucomicrobiota bacterium]